MTGSSARRPWGTSLVGLTALLVLAVLGAAACGPSDTAVTSTDPGESASTDGPSPDAGSPDAGSAVGDFCELNAELARLFGELAVKTGPDAEATWLNIEIVVEWLQQEAPAELADDVAAGAEYYAALGDALEAGDFANPVAIVESVPRDDEMDQIEARVDDYLDGNCRS